LRVAGCLLPFFSLIAWRLAKAAAATTRAIGGRDAGAVRAAAGLVSVGTLS
jgi:hypothetical protein